MQIYMHGYKDNRTGGFGLRQTFGPEALREGRKNTRWEVEALK
jgi:hypothetical protein